ncbi:MAG: hypothetical protein V1701_05825 [Planctomycetota bacterium]
MRRVLYRSCLSALVLSSILALGWGGMCGKDSPDDNSTDSSGPGSTELDNSARIIFMVNYSLVTSSGNLMSVPITGTTPALLGNGVSGWSVTPNKKNVLFQTNTGALKTVPVAGGTPLELATDVAVWQSAPDSSRIVYLTAGNNLKSVPITGGATAPIAGAVGSFSISPDSLNIIYATIVNSAAITGELYAAPITGGSNDLLSGDVPSITKTAVAADNAHIVYSSPAALLQAVPITGGAPTALVSGFHGWSLTPDRTRVIALNNYSAIIFGGDLRSLYTDGSNNLRLATYVYPGTWTITSDSARVIYLGNYNSDTELCNLKSVPVTSTGLILLDSQVWAYRLSPDTTMAVYLNGSSELRCVSVTGGAPVTLTDAPISGTAGGLAAPVMWQAASDNTNVVFMDNFNQVFQTGDLKTAPMAGGGTVLLDSGVTTAWDIAPGDKYAIYINLAGQLKTAPLSGDAPITLAEGVYSFQVIK